MKIILQQDVKNLGHNGDIIEVSSGYARNYLLPKKIAILATETNIIAIKQQKNFEINKNQRLLDEAMFLASQIRKISLTIPIKTGKGDKVFGSITSKDIAQILNFQYGLVIDKRKIELKEAIKNLGVYNIIIKLHQEISVTIEIKIVGN